MCRLTRNWSTPFRLVTRYLHRKHFIYTLFISNSYYTLFLISIAVNGPLLFTKFLGSFLYFIYFYKLIFKTFTKNILYSKNSFHPEFMPHIKFKVVHNSWVDNKAINPIADGPTTAVQRELKGHWAGHQPCDLHTARNAGTA